MLWGGTCCVPRNPASPFCMGPSKSQLSQTSLRPSTCPLIRLTANAFQEPCIFVLLGANSRAMCPCGAGCQLWAPGENVPLPSTPQWAARMQRGVCPFLLHALAQGFEAKTAAYTVTTHAEAIFLLTGLQAPRSRLLAVIKAH